MRRSAARILGALVTAVTLVGCTSTVTGIPVQAPADPDAAIVALLDTGNYPIVARDPFGTAGSGGSHFEAHRIAENVVGPWQVNVDLRQQPPLENLGFTAPIASFIPTSFDLPDPLPEIAVAHGFIAGFSSYRVTRGSFPHRELRNMVLRFPDPGSAAAAAGEMAGAVPQTREAPRRPLTLPDHPAAISSAYDDGGGIAIDSFFVHGPYVFYESAAVTNDNNNESSASRLIDNALITQERLIDQFEPTDPAKLGDLPKDPTGSLLAHTLQAPGVGEAGLSDGAWRPTAWLHFEDDPVDAATLFRDAGVVWVTQLLTTVYQTPSSGASTRVADWVAKQMSGVPEVKPTATGVPGYPSARCFTRTKGAAAKTAPVSMQRVAWHYKCVARIGRYAFTAFSDDEKDVKQQISAQYLILAGA
ncbi:hypothetical protein ACAG26_26030 [Mycobacterium sp. pUA109]|uniref:DUF7373 family lipoprotein n=1 Tax=Mycobacterium sp. pUA109 TaxID=3238982 RepID=UPI00351BA053